MKLSIRGQILIPVLAVQAAAVALLAVTSSAIATRKAEAEVVGRLDAVIATLGRSAFPLTPTVLEAMKGLSGAQFVLVETSGRVVETTLPGLPSDLPTIGPLPGRVALDSDGRSATMSLAGSSYLAASIPRAGRAGPEILLVLYPETAWRRARWDAATPPVAVGLAALVAMGLISGLVANRIGRRLGSLRAKTAAIAGGDFRSLAVDRRRDEVADLAASINQMCLQLHDMRETIRRTERAGILAQLAAGLAHSLRNAATGARMAIQLHARRCPSGREDRSLQVALRQLSLSEEQIRSLLAIGRPQPASRSLVDAGRVVADVAGLVEPSCRHSGVVLTHEEVLELEVPADAQMLRAAILNLALNAIEAAGPGGEVRIGSRKEGDGVVFEVEDSGPGPAAELTDTLFDPFVTSKPEGVGLGLAVARQVAADLGGTIGWDREGGSTRFRLAIPISGALERSKSPSHSEFAVEIEPTGVRQR